MTEVLMPRLDPGMQSGKIVEWLKKEGETVQKGQAIVVIEGEKTTFEVEAPETGPLSRLLAAVGDDVQVSQPIAIIGGSGSVSTFTQAEGPKSRVHHAYSIIRATNHTRRACCCLSCCKTISSRSRHRSLPSSRYRPRRKNFARRRSRRSKSAEGGANDHRTSPKDTPATSHEEDETRGNKKGSC